MADNKVKVDPKKVKKEDLKNMFSSVLSKLKYFFLRGVSTFTVEFRIKTLTNFYQGYNMKSSTP